MSPQVCAICGEAIPARATPGRPRRYCSGRCRTEAYRIRQMDAFDSELVGPQPSPAAYLRAELVQVAETIIEAEAKAPAEEQLARAIIEARALAAAFHGLSPQLPPALAWRAGTMAQQITTTLKRLFGGTE